LAGYKLVVPWMQYNSPTSKTPNILTWIVIATEKESKKNKDIERNIKMNEWKTHTLKRGGEEAELSGGVGREQDSTAARFFLFRGHKIYGR